MIWMITMIIKLIVIMQKYMKNIFAKELPSELSLPGQSVAIILAPEQCSY